MTTLITTTSFTAQENEGLQKEVTATTEAVVENKEEVAGKQAVNQVATKEETAIEEKAVQAQKKAAQAKEGVTQEEVAGEKEKEAAQKEVTATTEAEAKEKVADEKEKEAAKEEVTEKKEEEEPKEKIAAVQEKVTEVKEEVAQKEVADEKEKEAAQKEVIEKKEEEAATETKEEAEIKKEVATTKPVEQVAQEVEEIGIDTIDIDEPQGNWLFKRMWWEHAEKRYEKIRDLVKKIWESRMNFFIKRTELDKMTLDPFYISMGLGQGELYEILSELVSRIDQERKEEGVLTQPERSLLNRLKAEQQTLEQTKLDVELISQLDHDIDQALNRLMEQINRVRAYEREAWEHFKNIARVLNDKKARELFFKIDTALRNIKSIDDYLQRDFTQHFNQLLQKINDQVNKVTNEVQGLKEKGIDFKKQLDTIEAEEEQPVPEQEVEEEKEEEVTPGWGTRLWNNFVAIVRWPYEKLVGTKEPSE